ncbi:MAG: polysaccharide biosynthesis/export family protein [Myxococcaceae bacterium]
MARSCCFTLYFALLALCVFGCHKSPGVFLWVDEYVAPSDEGTGYSIHPGDMLNVRVFQQENISAKVRVRADGKVSLPFVNDVQAAGLTPVVLARHLEIQLKTFINNPVVTVSLEEVRTLSVSVLGEVVRPGTYQLEPGTGVLQALAMCGGLNPFAHADAVFVLRKVEGVAAPTRIRFTYPALARAEGRSGTFMLRWGDVIVVE